MQIPVGWGTHRSRCNLVDYLDFKSTPQKAAAAGKGGVTTGYNYSASIILAIEEGPIDHVTQVWVNGKQYAYGSNGSGVPDTQNTSALAQVGLTLGTGAIGQTPWSYLLSATPTVRSAIRASASSTPRTIRSTCRPRPRTTASRLSGRAGSRSAAATPAPTSTRRW